MEMSFNDAEWQDICYPKVSNRILHVCIIFMLTAYRSYWDQGVCIFVYLCFTLGIQSETTARACPKFNITKQYTHTGFPFSEHRGNTE